MGGNTFSNTLQGRVLKAKAIPVLGNSIKQVDTKQIMARVSTAWQGLTDLERYQWGLYAASVSFVNSLGVVYSINGFQMYCRSSAASLSGTAPFAVLLPTMNGLPMLPLVAFSYNTGTDTIDVDSLTPAMLTTDQLWGSIYIGNKPYSLNPGPRAAEQWGFDGSATFPVQIAGLVSTLLGSGREVRLFMDWRFRDDKFRISSKQRQKLTFTTI